jgi:hypothetical protein
LLLLLLLLPLMRLFVYQLRHIC